MYKKRWVHASIEARTHCSLYKLNLLFEITQQLLQSQQRKNQRSKQNQRSK